MSFIQETEEEEQGTEQFTERMTHRMRHVEREDLTPTYTLREGETPGCEQDELADYFRSDGQDPLE